jgi:PEP-CTERM motif
MIVLIYFTTSHGLSEIVFENFLSQYNTMKNTFKRYAIFAAFTAALTANPAKAANSFYAPGDLVLYFQQEGGTNTLYANLGSAATLYRGSAAGSADGVNNVNFLNLNSSLTTAFGAGWASDTSIYSGLAGVFSSSSTSSALVDGDPARTLYLSASRQSVGTVGNADSNGYTIVTNTGMSTGATLITQQNNILENIYTTAVAISPTGVSFIDDNNPFVGPGLQGTAFNIIGGGVQQRGTTGTFGNFGAAGSTEFALDLFRIVGKTGIVGQVEGDLRVGSYEGTVTVGTTGEVSFIANAVPEPSSLALTGLAVGALALRRRRSA